MQSHSKPRKRTRQKHKDISGQTFGTLTAIEKVGQKGRRTLWECRCSCGRTCVKNCQILASGRSVCECVRAKGQPEYHCWRSMKSRCFDRAAIGYKNYGSRGITVCERWNRSFSDFLTDMGRRPSKAHQLDRINNNGNYEPGNVRWVKHIQARNKRNNKIITHEGRSMNLSAWAELLGFKPVTLGARLKRGLTFAEAISKPMRSSPRPKKSLLTGRTPVLVGVNDGLIDHP